MKKVNEILNHPVYMETVRKIEELERERVFCGHDLSHFLDVARVACLLNAENGFGVAKELIYAAALLHDIGRGEQYLHGTPHHEASAVIAAKILDDCGFAEDEKEAVLEAILAHRSSGEKGSSLVDMIYRADKLSRPCFGCKAEAECNWSSEKKNLILNY